MRRPVLVINGSAARGGAGPSIIRGLAHSLPVVAPTNRYVFYLPSDLASEIPSTPERIVRPVPRPAAAVPARVIWEHFVLPRLAATHRAAWLLAPFNVLPLVQGFEQSIRRAVVIWNISPFARMIWKDLPVREQPKIWLLRKLTEMSIRRADLVFLVSLEAYRLLGSMLDDSRIRFIPTSPPPPATVQAASQAPIPSNLRDVPFFVLVGDLFPYKGVEDAILATRLLVRRGYRVRLLLCGASMHREYYKRLQAFAEAAGPAVRFLGRTPQSVSLALMRESAATISCSRIENTSLVPIEAMSLDSPVLISDVPNSRETCGTAAAYYPVGDYEALAALMMDMLEGRGREELIERGRKRLDELDWMSTSRKILEAMELS